MSAEAIIWLAVPVLLFVMNVYWLVQWARGKM